MISVYRYEVPVDGKNHLIRLTNDPTGVGLRRRGVVEFWATHNDDAEERERVFTAVGTGQELPDGTNSIWGYAYDGSLVWHLAEVVS